MPDVPAVRRPGRPREASVDRRLVEAVLALVRERGPRAVTIAAVSARSGVARTTVYRRFPDRRALLVAALSPLTDRGAPPQDLPVRGKLAWFLAATDEVLHRGIGPGGIAALLTEDDPDFTSVLREALEAGLAPVRSEMAADMAEGRLALRDPDLVLDLLLGLHLARRLRGVAAVAGDDKTAEQLEQLLGGR
ncbi:TetR/AcrR family transcriptional regulator [Nocardioides marmoribigeumensis]|uniref:AcrR family transcriptional regulator n=1 Tax=Nocardioides marmoribigeumensis TaxID=433649 RepID=A0ABU2BSF1_9ACTN|nr:helix-turn-helix domain-containing protein [Nocardioides marmoribigeumensis]MDR7360914.1 AcrR family transcriptional regulator [Nocardioides marmoribigeumensis]